MFKKYYSISFLFRIIILSIWRIIFYCLFLHLKFFFFLNMCCSDSLKETTVILQNAAVAPGPSPNRYRTFGPGPGRTTGATSCNLFWRVWVVRSVWETCGGFLITVTKAAEVSYHQVSEIFCYINKIIIITRAWNFMHLKKVVFMR